MGSPGSEHADHEPTATVLTAGSTKQGHPTLLLHDLCSHKKVRTKMLALLFNKRGLWERQQTLRAGYPVPCAVSLVKCPRRNEC